MPDIQAPVGASATNRDDDVLIVGVPCLFCTRFSIEGICFVEAHPLQHQLTKGCCETPKF
jgi:hypothetical protein